MSVLFKKLINSSSLLTLLTLLDDDKPAKLVDEFVALAERVNVALAKFVFDVFMFVVEYDDFS